MLCGYGGGKLNNLIELTGISGTAVYINLEKVVAFVDLGENGTGVLLDNGQQFEVVETLARIKFMIDDFGLGSVAYLPRQTD